MAIRQLILYWFLFWVASSQVQTASSTENEDIRVAQALETLQTSFQAWQNLPSSERLLSKLSTLHDNLRRTQSCNQIVESLSVEQVREFVASLTDDTLVRTFVTPRIRYGVQVRRVCAACNNFVDIPGFCTPSDYGYETIFSGLVLLPLQTTTSTTTILPGTLIPYVYGRGTRTDTEPSTDWERQGTEVLFHALVTSIQGAVSIIPDFMGYGESLGQISRAYIIRKSYQTSTIPLVQQVGNMLASETDCNSALARDVFVSGYSEGGYAAVAIAQAFESMGMRILGVHAGGGPYAISSRAILGVIEEVNNATFPSAQHYYFALLGSAYSSTYEDVSNFGIVDMLDPLYRDTLVRLVNEGASVADIHAAMDRFDPLSVFEASFLKFALDAIDAGEEDPCRPVFVQGTGSEVICQALKEQDLTEYLLGVNYPVQLCHSPTDRLVNFGNVPDASGNSFLTVEVSSGTHEQAAEDCLFKTLTFVLLGGLSSLNIEEQHLDTCTSPNNGGVSESTQEPTSPSGSWSLQPLKVMITVISLTLSLLY